MKTKTLILLALLITTARATDLRLAWDPIPAPALARLKHYNLYQSNGDTNAFVLRAQTTNTNLLLTGYGQGSFYFYVTALTTNNIESDASNIAEAVVPPPPRNLSATGN
jgi:hypothetical protein